MTDRQGIEIDYCPRCRGVWLDRGELDKIIERNGSGVGSSTVHRPVADHRDYEQPRPGSDEYRQEGHYDSRSQYHKKHKKENFLGDLFDF